MSDICCNLVLHKSNNFKFLCKIILFKFLVAEGLVVMTTVAKGSINPLSKLSKAKFFTRLLSISSQLSSQIKNPFPFVLEISVQRLLLTDCPVAASSISRLTLSCGFTSHSRTKTIQEYFLSTSSPLAHVLQTL